MKISTIEEFKNKFANTNYISIMEGSIETEQEETMNAFSNKWEMINHGSSIHKNELELQKKWYLDLYGFDSEEKFKNYLESCEVILDAGAGSAHKASWFAKLSPKTIVIAADISTSLKKASEYYSQISNLYFLQVDIAKLDIFSDNFFDYVSCDQVIHHTQKPRKTFGELIRVTKNERDFSCYVYRKKALPRELLDEYFRSYSKELNHGQILKLSEQLAQLGKMLSAYTDELEFESIPALGIEGGKMTIQRYIYWNFIKCFWDEKRGDEYSRIINYDWYSPQLAFRYSEGEFKKWIEEENLSIIHFHREPACYSGRFKKQN